jgi:cytochrome c3-like protein
MSVPLGRRAAPWLGGAVWVWAALLVGAPPLRAQAPAAAPDSTQASKSKPKPAPVEVSSCIACHRNAEEANLRKPVAAWSSDVHAAAGLGCESCHGGDPKRLKTKDPDEAAEAAMNPDKGFETAPDRLQVAAFCARCHSNAAFMKRYNPQLRVDQLAEYRTSVHGMKNAKGDPKPATCIDCHGAHGILPVSSPQSPVFATNVPKTCARCHADAAFMKPYGIPTRQYEDYKRSVHAGALLGRGDTAAPACNDCHGNHGAAPPEAKSVVHVCGQCHAREANLYHESMKDALFQRMKVPECIVCHGNHLIRHPTPEMFHSHSGPGVTSGTVTNTDPFAANLGDLAPGKKAAASWRVVIAPRSAAQDSTLIHRVEVTADSVRPLSLNATVRPEDDAAPAPARVEAPGRLAASLTVMPLRGLPVEAGDVLFLRVDVAAAANSWARNVRVRDLPGAAVQAVLGSACLQCHKLGDSCDVAAEKMYGALIALDRETRLAAATLHRAELLGMDVTGPKFELKSKGTTAAVESRALIHSFDPERLLKRAAEGRASAAAAMVAGQKAQDEYQFRRKGLAVSLVLIALVLLGLYLKIRELDRARSNRPGGTGVS